MRNVSQVSHKKCAGMGKNMNIAIITGASSGIGKEFVLQISNKYSNLDEIWIIARRKDRLAELLNQLHSNVKIMALDLTLDGDLRLLANELETIKPHVRLLVNCAGCGKIGPFELGAYEEEIGMINVNCKALTAVTYLVLPYMKERARIIEVASAAAFLPQPGFAVYAASKSFVLSFSRALKYELYDRKINVIAICPGPVDTEFFAIADPDNLGNKYKKKFRVKPQNVVAKALRDSALGDEISIYGYPMKIVYLFSKILPHKLILKILYERPGK